MVFFFILIIFRMLGEEPLGGSVALLVKCWILDFGSGHDLRVMRLSPTLGSMTSMESA